jgi:putative two-component system response regulator
MWVVRSLCAQETPVGIVVMSAEPSLDVARAVSRVGAVDCLPWPSSESTLVDAVQRAAKWRSALVAASQESRRLREAVEHSRRELSATMSAVAPATSESVLLAMLESRSPQTYDHVRRVARSAAALAAAMKLAPVEIQEIRTTARLHEIGKIAIPPKLLGWTGPLNDEEVRVFRLHAAIGAEVLGEISSLASVAPAVAAAYERYDGSGHPRGLAGEQIPLAARIVAAVDVYDGVTSGRPYGEPITHEDAAVELVRLSGSHLDPDVVRRWIALTEGVRCC